MKEALTVVTRKGQITMPVEIRRALDLKEGDKVAWSLVDVEKQEVMVRPVRSVAELTFGAIKPRKRPENYEELRGMFEQELAAEASTEGSASEDVEG